MLIKISSEQPFQIMASAFIIGASQSGYTLQFSADGTNYSDLFSVGAGVERMVTNVAANAYYKLRGNTGDVSVNYGKDCGGGGGEGAGVSSVNGKSGAVNLANINGFDLTNESAIGVYTGVWSGNKHYLAKENSQQGGMFLATINGQPIITDKDTPLDIQVGGGSGDYSVVDTLPEATKEGQMAYLSEDMTHQQPVTGVGGKSMEFGETGAGEYHIIQYGDADFRIHRNGDGEIYRVVSRGQDLPFSLDGTWYKLPKSFTNLKDAFYMFNGGWFWFYVYEGEEFATNDYGGGTYAAGETCDYVDTIIDYEKGQYIVKDINGTLSWEKYDFPAKVFVYDDREGVDHSEIANALAPYYVAQETGGQAAVGQLPRDLCVIYKGIAYYGPFSESDWDRELRMGSKTISFNDGQFASLKLIVEKSGNCREIGGDFSLSKPVYVSKEGIEGFDGATKITLKFNDGYEWYWDKELTTRIFIDGYERDLSIRPANYGEEYRINVKCQDWFDRDSIIAPDGPWDYNKLVKYETNEYSIFWVASFDYDTRTATINIKSGRNDELAFVASDSLQTEIDANHIEISIESGASVATVPSELSFKTGEGDKKVVLPIKPTFNLSINDEWTTLVNDDQLQGLLNYIKENGTESLKDIDVKVYGIGEEGEGDVYIPVEIYASSEGIRIIISYGEGSNYINVDYDGNTTPFTITTFVATNPNEHTVSQILQMSQAEYDALENKDGITLYIIVG